jgi:glycosyltransferase involved in cell wall biosynthesis
MSTLVSVFGVAPQRIGGTETFARELSVQLGERGWQSVLCFLSEPPEEVRSFLDLPNASLETFSDSTNGNRQGKRLSGIVGRYRPDILHLHFTGFLTLHPWQARIRSTEKIFFTDHHSRPAGYVPARAPIWKRATTRLINLPITKVISVSNYGYRCMKAADLLPQSRFEMIYNGVDLSRVSRDPQRAIEFRRRHLIPAERAIVVQVSWIIPEKGIADLLETARLVIAQNPNVQFVIVGEGAYREQYMRDAEAMGLGDHVTWTGMSRDPFGEGVFDAADVVCQMSRWEEVFGWMIAEAMAHGKPVVATRVGGIPELIADSVSGYLVARGDAEAASTRVLELLSDQKLRESMGQAARETVSDKFDLRKNVAQLMDAYGFSQEASSNSQFTHHGGS